MMEVFVEQPLALPGSAKKCKSKWGFKIMFIVQSGRFSARRDVTNWHILYSSFLSREKFNLPRIFDLSVFKG